MNTGSKSDAVAPGVKRHRNIVPRRQGRDFSYLRDAAGARHVRLDEIDGAAHDEIFEGVARMQVLADGDRRSTFLAENCVPFDVFDKQWLFEPKRAAVGKRI